LDRRVEALVRLSQPDHIRELNALFETAMDAKVASWYLDSAGAWTRHQNDDQGIGLVDLQDHIMQEVYAKRNVRI
jgi:polyphosphate kinase